MTKPKATIAITILLITGMLHNALHAAEFGMERHYHGDVACLLVLPEEEYDNPIPVQAREAFFAPKSLSVYPRFRQLLYSTLALSPPSTGPP